MNLKLLACLACSAALLVGACSDDKPPGTTSANAGNEDDASDVNGDDNSSGAAGSTALDRLRMEADAARTQAATAAAGRGDVAAARTEIERVKAAIAKAVTDAESAYTDSAGGTPAERLAAYDARAAARQLSNRQTPRLDAALNSLAWYGRTLVRYRFAAGTATIPAKTIANVGRTNIKTTGALGGANSNVNPFKTFMYEDGKKVFANTGDEFEVQGYTSHLDTGNLLDPTVLSGLKLTNEGLEIRTGFVTGQRDTNNDGTPDDIIRYSYEYADMRRNLNVGRTTGGSTITAENSNLWDLKITFDAPRPMPVPVPKKNWFSSWQGNGDFYWRSLVPLDDTQKPGGSNYAGDGEHTLPVGSRSLGTYEVWLSNHIGVDANIEPAVAGARGVECPGNSGLSGTYNGACPIDDDNFYLNYAAYGLFVFTTDPDIYNVRNAYPGRVQSMHFGYEAFGTGNGQSTTNIDKAIISGTFQGQTIAYAFKGDLAVAKDPANTSKTLPTKLLRGDVVLTVTIPKTSGTGSLTGEMKNFEEWFGNRIWQPYTEPGANFKVTLNDGESSAGAVDIGTDGSFRGVATATPAAGLNSAGEGYFYGNFYGPRTSAGLEAAGSWEVGVHDGGSRSESNYHILGSFGAKQRPPEAP